MKMIRWIVRVVPTMTVGFVIAVGLLAWLGEIDQVVEAKGEVVVDHFEVVRSIHGGIITAMWVKPGQLVEPGEPLVKIQDSELSREIQALEREVRRTATATADLRRRRNTLIQEVHPFELEELRIAAAQAEVEAEEVGGRLEELRVALNATKRDLTRKRELNEEGLVSPSELEEVKQRAEEALWRLRQTESREKQRQLAMSYLRASFGRLQGEHRESLEKLSAEIREKEHEEERLRLLLRSLDRELSQLSLKASIGGVVLALPMKKLLGQRVEAGEEIFTIIDPRSVQFHARVPEETIVRVREEQPVYVEIAGFPKRRFKVFRGSVIRIDQSLSDIPGQEGRSYPVLVGLREPWVEWSSQKAYLRDGMRGTARIVYRADVRLVQTLLDSLLARPEA